MTSPPKDIDAGSTALFLDVDGTLLDIQDDPAAVRADAALIDLLVAVERRLDGALSLISGRSVEDIDRVFAPEKFPAAGAHGVELRFRDGEDTQQAGMRLPEELFEQAENFVSEHPGQLVERKRRTDARSRRRFPAHRRQNGARTRAARSPQR
jgi:trehalose 6-phosphate phosphatase